MLVAIIQFFTAENCVRTKDIVAFWYLEEGGGNKKDLRHVIENHMKAILTLDYALEGSHKSRIVIIVICYCCSKKN